MRNLKKNLGISSLLLALSSLSVINAASAQEMYKAEYFSQTVYAGEIRAAGVNTAILSDIDLIRGNQQNEIILESSENLDRAPLQIFNGMLEYDLVNFKPVFTSGESIVALYFKDGSWLDNVYAIQDRFTIYGVSTSLFLIDQQALRSANKTMNDIQEVTVNQNTDHQLNYSEFGFTQLNSNIPTPQPDPESPIHDENNPNLIVGSEGRDNLKGTDGDDLINGKGGSRDVLTGNAGFDLFVFGAEANNNKQDRDVIVDFEPSNDALVLEHGATIKSVRNKNGSTIIRLNGNDADNIRLRGVQLTASQIDTIYIDGSYQ